MPQAIGADLWLVGRDFNYAGDRQQWSWAGPRPALQRRWPTRRCAAPTSCSTRRACWRRSRPCASGCRYAQAVRNGLATVELPGRFQIVPGQPTLVLDVAHNPHAVGGAGREPRPDGLLPAHARGVRRDADKDIDGVIARMAPLVDAWYCTDLPLPRAATRGATGARCCARCAPRAERQQHAWRPVARRCAAALGRADPADRILVFGSFLTVGGVLREGLPRLAGRHAP